MTARLVTHPAGSETSDLAGSAEPVDDEPADTPIDAAGISEPVAEAGSPAPVSSEPEQP